MKGQLFALKKPLLESKSAFDKVIAGVIAKEPDFEQQLLKIHPLKNKKLKQDAKEGWCTIGPEQLASHDLSAGKRDWVEHLQAHFPTEGDFPSETEDAAIDAYIQETRGSSTTVFPSLPLPYMRLLFKHAAECQERVGTFLRERWGSCAVVPLIKALESAIRKVRDSYNGDWSKMRDISRFSFKTTTFSQIYEAYETLRNESWVEIVQVKNKYQTPNFMGYRDINMNLRITLADGSKHLCELQMHLEQVLEIKNTVNHRCYEEVRLLLPQLCADVKDAGGKAINGDTLAKDIIGRLDSSAIEMIVEKLEAKAGGLFQYAKLLEDQLKKFEGKKIDFDAVLELPSGLDDMYATNFQRTFLGGKGWDTCESVLAMICAAQEPLPVSLVEGIVGKDSFVAVSEHISLLFPEGRDHKLRVMHKSVVDWLKRENGSMFTIGHEQIEHAHAELGKACLRLTSSKSSNRKEDED